MPSVANVRPESTLRSTCSGHNPDPAQVESRALLALSVLDHRMATRDRYVGAERDAFIAEAIHEARMALDGMTIETILESRDRKAVKLDRAAFLQILALRDTPEQVVADLVAMFTDAAD